MQVPHSRDWYQIFNKQIGKNKEVYVNDMLVKSQEAKTHFNDLQEMFDTLRRYKLKLNPNECVFGVLSGKFLYFMVSQQGIEANPKMSKLYLT